MKKCIIHSMYVCMYICTGKIIYYFRLKKQARMRQELLVEYTENVSIGFFSDRTE